MDELGAKERVRKQQLGQSEKENAFINFVIWFLCSGILRHRRKPSSSRPYQPHPSRLKKMVIVQEEEEEEADRADADDDASDVSADEIGGRADLPPKPQSPKHETSLSRSNSDVGLEINFDRRRKRDNDDESMV